MIDKKYINWLDDIPEEMRGFMADIYTDTMSNGVCELNSSLCTQDILSIIHRIKKSISMAGHVSLYRQALKVEILAKTQEQRFTSELSKFIKNIEDSIQAVEAWRQMS